MADFAGGLPQENAQITHDILSGKDKGPRRDIVLLNAAAALSVDNNDLAAGLAQAREAIDSGQALAVLSTWIEQTNQFKA
jgi:anthranilate phosphoribosyltransferase